VSGGPSKFQIADVEAALIALLNSSLPVAYGTSVDIDSIGDKDFLDDGTLTLQPPSVRVRFAGAKYNNLRDNQRLSYEATLLFEIMCFESSLRSKADERLQTLQLVQVIQDQLAGARLALADGTSSMPLELDSVSPVITETGPVDQLYAIVFAVNGIAQFSGANARFGQ
jgi:phage gp37-like protein